MGKGAREERLLATRLDDDGFAVIRAPASGGGTQRDLPDLLFGCGGFFIATELKVSGGDPIYLSGEEVDALEYFATNFGAAARIGVKFSIKRGDPAWGDDENPGWYFFRPSHCYTTDGGNYRVKKETALADGQSYQELLAEAGVSQAAD